MNRYISVCLAIGVLFIAKIGLAEEVVLQDDLKNLGAIGLKVGVTHKEKSSLAKKLSKSRVYTLALYRLKMGRIKVLEGDRFHSAPGQPYLSVVLITVPLEPKDSFYVEQGSIVGPERLHMYGVRVYLYETANLTRNGKKALVNAWESSILGWSRTYDRIEDVIKETVEKFVRAYITANPN